MGHTLGLGVLVATGDRQLGIQGVLTLSLRRRQGNTLLATRPLILKHKPLEIGNSIRV
jgi:hypothetical protein